MPEDIRMIQLEETPTDRSDDPTLLDRVVEAIQKVYDPEIPVNIWELGLIYNVDISAEKDVKVDMTLTTPMCPSAQELPHMVDVMVSQVEGVRSCDVEIVWEPPWTPERMSEVARLELGMF